MKEIFNKAFWATVFNNAKQLAEAVAIIIVSGVAIYFTKHGVESVLYQRVFFIAEGIVLMRGGWEFMRHLARQDNRGRKS